MRAYLAFCRYWLIFSIRFVKGCEAMRMGRRGRLAWLCCPQRSHRINRAMVNDRWTKIFGSEQDVLGCCEHA
ncbi:hypothetical protein BKA67DRAFT_560618 [Truncatella angustata]|uniref:Secreted protein n=1 Tax=Truncatella angustata TaxID=152316 RepID=A0A9P8ZXY0_9PEZI|nr:uncharacterized protein BKA67DRAFT_560618 [Truncatella angustata]KAH6655416.1 hypothetical protein BKA67DRAFT_560618 [Truncatella angustata]